MLRAGFAKRDITPTGPARLAGYVTLRPRVSRTVRDPLFVRAIAFEQGDLRAVVIVFDLLLITDELSQRVRARLADDGAQALLAATHTHSAHGGYWKVRAAQISLGPYHQEALDGLCDVAVEVAREALADLGEASWAVQTAQLPDLAVNRRDERQAPDDELWALRIHRGDADALLVGFPSHPVIVAERDPLAISADFPGAVVRGLEEKVDFAAFINGPVGGTGTHFPEGEMSAEDNLEEQSRPLIDAALRVLDAPLNSEGALRFATRELPLPAEPAPLTAFDDQSLGKVLTWPLDRLARWIFSDAGLDHSTLQALALGEAVLVGTPADLGYNVAQAIKQSASALGLAAPFVASQADGYIGYVHRRDDYRHRPERGTLGMALYENVMGIFGHDLGETLLEETATLLGALHPENRPCHTDPDR